MKKQSGFTLIELMITVAIIAILAAIGYPSYREFIQRGHRGEAKTALLRAGQQMERYYSLNNCYPSNSANCGNAATSAAALTAAGINSFSGDSSTGSFYDLAVSVTAQAYTLTATPRVADAKCANFTYTNAGAKSQTGTGTVGDCWAK